MTTERAPGQETGAVELRAALRQGLITAMKARDSDTVAALRTAMAAIDNAEAVPAPAPLPGSARIAGARSGAGSTEAARRVLTGGELDGILRAQVAGRLQESGRYEALGQADAAGRLRRQAAAIEPYLRH
jgi:uncharacterized protein